MKIKTDKRLWSLGLVLALLVVLGWQPAHASAAETKHPLVLVHGLAGFDSLAGVYQYFYGIPRRLEREGAEVFLVQVSAANSSEWRGEQLLEQVEDILSITGAEKVNLIGHSHGSMTARYVAGVRPDLVASVTSVGGVNWGSRVADAVGGGTNGGFTGAVINAMGDALFGLIDLLSFGFNSIDTRAALASLSTEGSLAFNRNFPAGVSSEYCADNGEHVVDGVRYYSWGSRGHLTNGFDPSDYLLLAMGAAFRGEQNDGLVSVCSQQLGQSVGFFRRMNHLDQVNQIAGFTPLLGTNPNTVWRNHANRLKNDGL
ncbi:hypothetical protein CAI21_10800 [Alkalilimnicola ehrlichii]|uniref:AB hydrolase-1 domain-containing protein n=1 Tax=Alkalilimnicola ehrlichii TaxID=351052 RepID=A0A3E0WT57_9GAMM|nr:triacylglycerol lipase [Alkalilimnicola ehrlichii]RFA29243.1 hypothetical protein CAI21_10800 [Alkalilimnicola ehrlichii]RFA36154.1 hypothetical protein CAL65_11945 [Alkalilimnicola ehrlichii]